MQREMRTARTALPPQTISAEDSAIVLLVNGESGGDSRRSTYLVEAGGAVQSHATNEKKS